jgi:hypothetical protein
MLPTVNPAKSQKSRFLLSDVRPTASFVVWVGQLAIQKPFAREATSRVLKRTCSGGERHKRENLRLSRFLACIDAVHQLTKLGTKRASGQSQDHVGDM